MDLIQKYAFVLNRNHKVLQHLLYILELDKTFQKHLSLLFPHQNELQKNPHQKGLENQFAKYFLFFLNQ